MYCKFCGAKADENDRFCAVCGKVNANNFLHAFRYRKLSIWIISAFSILVLICSMWGINYMLVGYPVRKELSADYRNKGFTLDAHYHYYLDLNTVVLDLKNIDSAAPIDLFRGLFQAAKALHKSGRKFDKVVLSRTGTPVFYLRGNEFLQIGMEYGYGQNPIYLVRTLPEKLYRPSGEAAFGRWTGGLLGVLGEQMKDVNEVALQWAAGK